MPWSIVRCSGPLRNLLPSKEAAKGSEDPPCPAPLAEAAGRSCRCPCFVRIQDIPSVLSVGALVVPVADRVADQGAHREADGVWDEQGVEPPFWVHPSACGDENRRAVEYIDYTFFYLPPPKSPGCPMMEEANRAILAARIAFSSFWILSCFRYGPRACSNVF